MTKLVLSHRLDLLARHLALELAQDGLGVFAPRTIVVPSTFLKQWILIQLANSSQEKAVAGCRILTLQEALEAFIGPSGEIEIFSSIFQELSRLTDPELDSYRSPKRMADLAEQLTQRFIQYGTYFLPDGDGWQERLFQKLFVSGPLKLPLQMSLKTHSPLHAFGFDFLPPALWQLFDFRTVYLFSPCSQYWEDVCTDRERARIGRYWKKKGASQKQRDELEGYLKNAPPLLANWGKIGRETIKALDPLVDEIEEDYTPPFDEANSALSRLRGRLLDFALHEGIFHPEDLSIQITKTGSSLFREVEALREGVLRLANEKGVSLSEMAVFAPDIQPYVPLIQFVFGDLPYRISGLEIGSRSFFFQGLHKLLSEEWVDLFENPSFCRKRNWDANSLEKMRPWLANEDEIEDQVLEQLVFLNPKQTKGISFDDAEQLIETVLSLKADLASLRENRTLADWSDLLLKLVEKHFEIDASDEADSAAWGFFQYTMHALSKAAQDGPFPFAPIRSLLKRPISGGQIHSSYLHAIRFATLAEGAIVPARAIFLIGMNEDHFPRRARPSSLDLLKREKIYTSDAADRGRYAFLQALFSGKEFLHISYSHLAPDGTPVNPTPLMEELAKSLDAPIAQVAAPLPLAGPSYLQTIDWPHTPDEALPEGEWTVSLKDLASLARHPWEFYLKNQYGIRFEKEDELPFGMLSSGILKAGLQNKDRTDELPPGICGEALKIDLDRTAKEWTETMQERGLTLEPISFRKCCKERKKTAGGWELPPLRFELTPSLTVYIVGDVPFHSSKGYVHTGKEDLPGILKVWPEILAASIASNSCDIQCLRLVKPRTIRDPAEAMKAFLKYYFYSLSAPSPLLPAWADPMLRKGIAEKESRQEDPVFDWVSMRASLPSDCLDSWGPFLTASFSELTALYPRGKNADV